MARLPSYICSHVAPGQRGAAVADIFRLEDGVIVKHRDVLQRVPEQAVRQHPMF